MSKRRFFCSIWGILGKIFIMDRIKYWLKRFGYLLLIILWLVAMLFPAFAFILAAQEQIELGRRDGVYVRFFLVREDDGEGIGIESARPFSGEAQCVKNSITYLLWEGDAGEQNNSYCQCYDPDTGEPLPVVGDMCAP